MNNLNLVFREENKQERTCLCIVTSQGENSEVSLQLASDCLCYLLKFTQGFVRLERLETEGTRCRLSFRARPRLGTLCQMKRELRRALDVLAKKIGPDGSLSPLQWSGKEQNGRHNELCESFRLWQPEGEGEGWTIEAFPGGRLYQFTTGPHLEFETGEAAKRFCQEIAVGRLSFSLLHKLLLEQRNRAHRQKAKELLTGLEQQGIDREQFTRCIRAYRSMPPWAVEYVLKLCR